MIKLAIVEDDAEIRQGLIDIIATAPDIKCIAAYADAEAFIHQFSQVKPQVVLMDIHLPGMSGIDCIRRQKPLRTATQYMISTIFEDADNIFNSLCAGATGYILKNTPPAKLFEAVREIVLGGSPMSPQIARLVVHSFQQKPAPAPLTDRLSNRERQILEYLTRGYRYKEIAATLFISNETVRTHIRNIYEKLQVQSRAEAVNKLYGR